MRLGTAIELLIDNYRYASDKEWIQDKVAWALYHTWKEADRKTEQTEQQTCSFSDCDNFKNPDYARCIECKRKQIMLKDKPQTERSE